MHNDSSLTSTNPTSWPTSIRTEYPNLCWRAILGGTLAAIGIHILLTALGVGAGLATFSPVTDENPVSTFSIGAGIVWTICALVALAFGGFVAGRFSHSHHSGLVHGVLVWCATLILTLLFISVGTGMVMGGALKVFGSSMGMAAQGLGEGAGTLAKEGLKQSSDQVHSFISEAVQSGSTNATPKEITSATREIGFAVTKLFTPGNETNRVANRVAAVQALTQHSGLSEPDATKAVDGWIESEKKLQAELSHLKEVAEEKARAAAQIASDNLSSAALWSFFGLLAGLLITAFSGRWGAVCALGCNDTKERQAVKVDAPVVARA